MDLTAPFAAVLSAASAALTALTDALTPLAGSTAAALAVALITLAVRTAFIPLGMLQARADVQRRRLAPKLAELQRRHAKRPEVLQQKTLELYRDAGVSPFAGILPGLAQVPIVSTLYGVFVSARIGGDDNALLHEELLGVPLGSTVSGLLGGGAAIPSVLVPLALVLVIAAAAWWLRRWMLRTATPVEGPAAGMLRATSWLSFLPAVIALFVPLAAVTYLAISTAWTALERPLLRRRAERRLT